MSGRFVGLVLVVSSMFIVACGSSDAGDSGSEGSPDEGSTPNEGPPSATNGSDSPKSSTSDAKNTSQSTSSGAKKAAYGESCAVGSQCTSGLCSSGHCTQLCSDAEPCPGGAVCKVAPGYTNGGACGPT